MFPTRRGSHNFNHDFDDNTATGGVVNIGCNLDHGPLSRDEYSPRGSANNICVISNNGTTTTYMGANFGNLSRNLPRNLPRNSVDEKLSTISTTLPISSSSSSLNTSSNDSIR